MLDLHFLTLSRYTVPDGIYKNVQTAAWMNKIIRAAVFACARWCAVVGIKGIRFDEAHVLIGESIVTPADTNDVIKNTAAA